MGAFFTNVQVHINDLTVDEMRGKMIEATQEWMRSLSFVEAVEGETCDRAVLIGPATSQPWIAVYDQATEDQDMAQLEALTSMLSSAVNRVAVGILVHDSDLLELRLFRSGTKIDEFCSWPGYFAGKSKPRRGASRKGAGHPEVWRDLFISGATEQDLRAAWESPATFEEASKTLERMAPIVGWSPELPSVGYRSVPDSVISTCTKLCFRREPQPSRTAKSARPPVLAHEGGVGPELEAYVGDPVALSAVAHNTGGASQGITIVIWGPALDQEMVDPTHVTVTSGLPEAGHVVEANLEATPGETGTLRIATLGEIALPEGLAGPAAAFDAASGHYELGMKAWLRTRIQASMETPALRADSADLHIGLVPAANPDAGQTSWTIQLQIAPKPRRPLRYVEGNAAFLRQLEVPRTLLALIALGADQATCAAVSGEAFERWSAVINPAGKGNYETMLSSASDFGLQASRLPAREIPNGRRWHEICAVLEKCDKFSATLHTQPFKGDIFPERPHGFALHVAQVLRVSGSDEVAPQLALWMYIEEMEPQKVKDATRELVNIVDDVMARANGLQAFVARWDWSPGDNVNVTPYEEACGIEGGTTGQAWCSRYLRGTSETIWLGPAMLSQLSSAEALEAIAEVKPVSNGLRVSLRSETNLDDLERVLLPLLPSVDDWHRAIANGTSTTG